MLKKFTEKNGDALRKFLTEVGFTVSSSSSNRYSFTKPAVLAEGENKENPDED